MKTLSERQLDRVARKAENCLIEGTAFDASRGGVGRVNPRVRVANRDEIEQATSAEIERTAVLLGTPEQRQAEAVQCKVKVGGV